MAIYKVTFQPEGKTVELLAPQFCTYQLSENEVLPVSGKFTWCPTCQMVTPCEFIESLDQIELALNYLRAHPDFRVDSVASRSLKAVIEIEKKLGLENSGLLWRPAAELDFRHRWRASRVSAPRCLLCGSTRLTAVRAGELMDHPRGYGTIQLEFYALGDYMMGGWKFTSEGHRIPGTGWPISWPGVQIPSG